MSKIFVNCHAHASLGSVNLTGKSYCRNTSYIDLIAPEARTWICFYKATFVCDSVSSKVQTDEGLDALIKAAGLFYPPVAMEKLLSALYNFMGL